MRKQKTHLRNAGRAFILMGGSLLLASCVQAPTIFRPVASNAQAIYQLSLAIFIIAAIVFVVVEGWLLYTAIHFRGSVKTGYPKQVEGNTLLEIGWTGLPLITLMIVFFFTVRTLNQINYVPNTVTTGNMSSVSTNNVLRVTVIGHQWWWEFKYPDLNIDTANELHVPLGVQVEVNVESADVIHSFWVPQIAGKMDAVPGHINHVYFVVNDAGTYLGQCAEYCGTEHAWMRLAVIAEDPAQFQAWVKNQQAPPVTNLTGAAAQGEQVFMNGACVGCHTINGTKAQGKVGPNLTHFASRNTFAGASQINNAQDVAAWLANPQAIKPGVLMPNLHLSQDQISQLVAYLESLK